MQIRQAVLNDAQAIATVHVTSWRETYAGIIPASYLDRLDIAERKQIWTTAVERGQSVLVAVVDDKVVGFANGGRNRDKDTPYAGELYAIYLLKDFQKRGIGKQLFDGVVAQLTSENCLPFVTWVLADNPTLGFYQHTGGKIVAEQIEDFDGCKLKEFQLAWTLKE